MAVARDKKHYLQCCCPVSSAVVTMPAISESRFMGSLRALTRGIVRRVLRSGLLAAVGLLICLAAASPHSPALAGSSVHEQIDRPSSSSVIPIERQPFYGVLVEKAADWDEVVLDHVVGDSPQVTLLNFYLSLIHISEPTRPY